MLFSLTKTLLNLQIQLFSADDGHIDKQYFHALGQTAFIGRLQIQKGK